MEKEKNTETLQINLRVNKLAYLKIKAYAKSQRRYLEGVVDEAIIDYADKIKM